MEDRPELLQIVTLDQHEYCCVCINLKSFVFGRWRLTLKLRNFVHAAERTRTETSILSHCMFAGVFEDVCSVEIMNSSSDVNNEFVMTDPKTHSILIHHPEHPPKMHLLMSVYVISESSSAFPIALCHLH